MQFPDRFENAVLHGVSLLVGTCELSDKLPRVVVYGVYHEHRHGIIFPNFLNASAAGKSCFPKVFA